MVKIVNGEIVQDAEYERRSKNVYSQPSSSQRTWPASPGVYDPFPSTEGKLGSLSERYRVSNVESELIWPVSFLVVTLLFGVAYGVIFILLLALYKNNAKHVN